MVCVLNASGSGAARDVAVSTAAVTGKLGSDVIEKTANPEFMDSDSVYEYDDFSFVGFEVWQGIRRCRCVGVPSTACATCQNAAHFAAYACQAQVSPVGRGRGPDLSGPCVRKPESDEDGASQYVSRETLLRFAWGMEGGMPRERTSNVPQPSSTCYVPLCGRVVASKDTVRFLFWHLTDAPDGGLSSRAPPTDGVLFELCWNRKQRAR